MRIRLSIRRHAISLIFFLVPILFGGCSLITVNVIHDEDGWRTGNPLIRSTVAGHSVEGRPIECRVLGRGRDTALILASIHGDETAGTPLLKRLEQHLVRRPLLLEGRRIVLVPVANPDGVARRRRFNVRGVDLNRNFAAPNRSDTPRYGLEPLSAPESKVVDALLWRFSPDRMVSIHQPLECVELRRSRRGPRPVMSDRCGLPVNQLGGRPARWAPMRGSLSAFPSSPSSCPAPRTAGARANLWETYGEALLEAVTYTEDISIEDSGRVAKVQRTKQTEIVKGEW
jgi:protein MpaA